MPGAVQEHRQQDGIWNGVTQFPPGSKHSITGVNEAHVATGQGSSTTVKSLKGDDESDFYCTGGRKCTASAMHKLSENNELNE